VVRPQRGPSICVGPDLKARYGEPSAPTDASQVQPNEMNPLTYCLVLRESDEASHRAAGPLHYDERTYYGTNHGHGEKSTVRWSGRKEPWGPVRSRLARQHHAPRGPYNEAPTVYTHPAASSIAAITSLQKASEAVARQLAAARLSDLRLSGNMFAAALESTESGRRAEESRRSDAGPAADRVLTT